MNKPQGFPSKPSEEDLENFISKNADNLNERSSLNTVMHVTPFIQIALIELQKRNINSLVKANGEASKISRIALGISCLSLVLALLAASFAYLDYISDSKWQTNQINELRNVRSAILNGY